MRYGFSVALGALLFSSAAVADDYIPPVVGGRTWIQQQIEVSKRRHPHIQAIIVTGPHDKTHENVLLGTTLGAQYVFTKVPPAAADGATSTADGGGLTVREALLSSSRHRLGTIEVRFGLRPHHGTTSLIAEARAVQTELMRSTLSAKNAIDPYPYDAAYGPDTFAQALTERFIRAHPDLLVMMIHATRPGAKDNIIIGSNIGRFGKLADEDDLRVIEQGSTNLEVGGDKDRFETELPLLDASGARIGALGLVFNYRDGQNKEAIHAHGIAIRDELAKVIPNAAALFAAR